MRTLSRLDRALTLEQRSYSAGRRDEILSTAQWLCAFVEDMSDLVAFAFLDGCAFEGADMDEPDEERGAAALALRDRYAENMRAAARDWHGGR